MIFAHLILAHDRPAQIAMLLDRLLGADDRDFAIVHVDAKSPPAVRDAILRVVHPRLHLLDRPVPVRWGHRSQLRATRLLIDAALARPFDVAHLLSGTDWPVRPRTAVAADIRRDPEACFIDCSGSAQQDRMQSYWLHDRLLGPARHDAMSTAAKRALKALGRLADRLTPTRANPYAAIWRKGSQWWSLPRDVCVVVGEELRRLERTGRLRFTACSDEHVIQTIVAARFPGRVRPNRRFIDWSDDASSPRVLTRDDRPAIRASDAWLARKVDLSVDPFFTDLPLDQ